MCILLWTMPLESNISMLGFVTVTLTQVRLEHWLIFCPCFNISILAAITNAMGPSGMSLSQKLAQKDEQVSFVFPFLLFTHPHLFTDRLPRIPDPSTHPTNNTYTHAPPLNPRHPRCHSVHVRARDERRCQGEEEG